MLIKSQVFLFALSLSITFPVDAIRNPDTIYVTNAPWHFEIITKNPEIHCGGTLISKRHVLTAASCANRQLQCETVSRSHKGEEVTYDVERYVRHPKYHEDHVNYDVAVLTLARAVETNEEMKMIRWNQNEISATGRPLQLVGIQAKTTNSIKKFWRSFWRKYDRAYGTVMAEDRCNEMELSLHGLITNSSLCLEFEDGTAPHERDLGSGAVLFGKQFLLMGVLTEYSHGIGILIRTAFVSDFILDELGDATQCYDLKPCF